MRIRLSGISLQRAEALRRHYGLARASDAIDLALKLQAAPLVGNLEAEREEENDKRAAAWAKHKAAAQGPAHRSKRRRGAKPIRPVARGATPPDFAPGPRVPSRSRAERMAAAEAQALAIGRGDSDTAGDGSSSDARTNKPMPGQLSAKIGVTVTQPGQESPRERRDRENAAAAGVVDLTGDTVKE